MAIGGWIYHTMYIASFDHNNDALWESNVIDPLIALLAGISGWSVLTGKTKYQSDSGWYFEMQHTGGAVLSVVVGGAITSTAVYIHASNITIGTDRLGTGILERLMLSYWPPGHTGAGAATPNLPGYVPAGGLQFNFGSASAGIVSGNTNRFHILARGDDLMFIVQLNTDPANHYTLMGSMMEPLHASDSGSRSAEAQFTHWSDGSWRGQFYAADNTTRVFQDAAVMLDNYNWLTTSVANAAPWPWAPMLAGFTIYPINGGGVVTYSGMKGRISPEWFRMTVNGGPAQKQRLSGGNLIHVGSGAVFGYDTGNGAMS